MGEEDGEGIGITLQEAWNLKKSNIDLDIFQPSLQSKSLQNNTQWLN